MKTQPQAISEILRMLEANAPSGCAEPWDNVGLLVGDPAWKTTGAVLSIDLTPEAMETARAKGFRLIINHHPCIFPKSRGLTRVTAGSPVFEALRNRIAVISSHTNFDRCALEVVQQVSQGLKLKPVGRLIEKPSESLTKLVVFVPLSHLEQVRQALCEAGAGHVGAYDHCTFDLRGQGTFRGSEDTRPFIGRSGRLERVDEARLETIFPRGLKMTVLKALKDSHPYEEVAFDLYPIEQAASSLGLVRGLGYGFWGEFPAPKPFSDVVKDVKSLFNVGGFWLTNPPPSQVRRVAFAAGKGADFIESAAAVGCDLFITGEAGYHRAIHGSREGVAIMELGHRESERFFLKTMKKWLDSLKLKTALLDLPTQRIWTGGKK